MNFNGYYQTPPVVKNLIIVNALFLLATSILPSGIAYGIEGSLALYPAASPHFHSWQVVTYMFLHAGFSHFFFNMFALWMFGRTLEYDLGSRRFLIYYMVCGIGAALLQLGINWVETAGLMARYEAEPTAALARQVGMALSAPTVGASGAVFGILLGFGMLHPNNVIMLLFPPVAMKAKYFVMIYGAIELVAGMAGRMDNVAHFAHVGGMLWGLLLLWWWRRSHKIFW